MLFATRKDWRDFDVVLAIGANKKFVIGSMNEKAPLAFGLVVSPNVGSGVRLRGLI